MKASSIVIVNTPSLLGFFSTISLDLLVSSFSYKFDMLRIEKELFMEVCISSATIECCETVAFVTIFVASFHFVLLDLDQKELHTIF